MNPFDLTETAYRDLDLILAYVIDHAGVDAAYEFRAELFKTLARLAEYPGLGHS